MLPPEITSLLRLLNNLAYRANPMDLRLPFEKPPCKNPSTQEIVLNQSGPRERNVLMRCQRFLVLLLVLIAAGCSRSAPEPVSVTASPSPTGSPAQVAPSDVATLKPRVDACALLTSKEIETIQGEAPKENKLTGQSAAGFSISQCFFTLPTFTNSISLSLTQQGEGTGARDPKDYWRDTFHEKGKDKDKDKDRGADRDKKKGAEEEEEGAPPERISGVGDEAYWVGSRVGGVLYVLKGNVYLRISIGGAADQTSKIKVSKLLAQKALARL